MGMNVRFFVTNVKKPADFLAGQDAAKMAAQGVAGMLALVQDEAIILVVMVFCLLE